MRRRATSTDDFFKVCGKQGGDARARRLSCTERSLIASLAARKRWGKDVGNMKGVGSIRLEKPQMTDPVFVEEILSDGSVQQWQLLYHEIFNFPFGKTVEALEKVLAGPHLYGITPLWRGILGSVQGRL